MLLLVILICDNVVANFASEYYLVCRQHSLLNRLWFIFILSKMLLSGFHSIRQSLLAS
jgi:hypothetical protein